MVPLAQMRMHVSVSTDCKTEHDEVSAHARFADVMVRCQLTDDTGRSAMLYRYPVVLVARRCTLVYQYDRCRSQCVVLDGWAFWHLVTGPVTGKVSGVR